MNYRSIIIATILFALIPYQIKAANMPAKPRTINEYAAQLSVLTKRITDLEAQLRQCMSKPGRITQPPAPVPPASQPPAAIVPPTQHSNDNLSPTDARIKWSFENIQGTTVMDNSNAGNNGILANAVITSDGHTGKAVLFNGTNATVTSSLNLNESLSGPGATFDLWVKPTSTNGGTVLSTDNSGWDWSIFQTGGTWHISMGRDQDTRFGVDVNAWQHLVVVFDTKTKIVSFYKNDAGKDFVGLTSDGNSKPITLGVNPSFGGTNFAGLVDDVMVYAMAKQPEAQSLVPNGMQPTRRSDDIVIGPNDARIKWSFENIQGTTVMDDSNAGNNGTMVKAIVSEDGHSGKAVTLNGADAIVTSSLKLNESMSGPGATLSVWVKPTSSHSGTLISTDDGGWDWAIFTTGGSWHVSMGRDQDTGLSVDVNEWQHLTAVFDTATKTVSFYKNGARKSFTGLTADGDSKPVMIGANPTFGGTNFAGMVDDVVIYATAKQPE